MRHGGGGAATRFVCGYLACSRSVCRPLLEALPRVLRIPIGDGPAAAMLRELLRVGVRESAAARPGARVDARQARRAHVRRGAAPLRRDAAARAATAGSPACATRTSGARSRCCTPSPAGAWTVDELAREVAISRSALAERFAALVGEPPIQYLMRWRLALAAQALRAGDEAIVAHRRAQRLRVGSGVQPRLQARVRHAARRLEKTHRQLIHTGQKHFRPRRPITSRCPTRRRKWHSSLLYTA